MENRSYAFNFLDKSGLPKSEDVKLAVENKLKKFGFDSIEVDDVDVDIDGDISITFVDEDDNEMEVIFMDDPEDGPVALVIGDDDEDEESELTVVDLSSLSPAVIKTGLGTYLNMTDLDWINRSTFLSIFQGGDIDNEDEDDSDNKVNPDPYGYIDTSEGIEGLELVVEARKVYVVRGGKRVKLAIVRKVRRKILTGKQKAGFKKAARKRKAKKSVIARKRKLSLRVRKRSNMKKVGGLSRAQKVAGTANRRR